jgi:hypothetical protein
MTGPEFINHVEGRGLTVKSAGPGQWMTQCSAHEDRSPSLSVSEGDGKILLNCHAGCETSDVCERLGLTVGDLFDAGPNGNGRVVPIRPEPKPDPLPTDADLKAWAEALSPAIVERLQERRGWTAGALEKLKVGYARRELVLPIRNMDGETVNAIRLSGPELAPFALKGRRRDLFPGPESVPEGERVWVTEGEKDAIALCSMGLSGVGIPGAKGWKPEHASRFTGRNVVLIGDCDAPGRGLMEKVAGDLVSHAASVRVLDLDPNRDDGHDVGSELVAALADGGTHEDVAGLIGDAADGVEPLVTPPFEEVQPDEVDPMGRRVRLTKATDVKSEVVRWAWQDRLPLGALSLLAGQPGLGKSTATSYLAAQLSRGELEGSLYGDPCDVLLVTLEDHIAAVVRPRLEAAGANLDRVHFLGVEEEGQDGLITLPDDLPAIEEAAQRLNARLLVIDPIVATLSKSTDAHKDQSVRRALAPLASYAERAGIAVCAVMHLNKGEADNLLNRVSGSVGFGGAARAVLGFMRDPDDADADAGYDRLLLPVKSNWGQYPKTLRCRVESASIETTDGPSSQSLLRVIGESDITQADLSGNTEPGEGDEADEFLDEQLGDGEWHPRREIKTAADAQKLAWKTVERAAKNKAVERERKSEFHAQSEWRLALAPRLLARVDGASGWRECENGSTEPKVDGSASTRAIHTDGGASGANRPEIAVAADPGTDGGNTAEIELMATPEQEALLDQLGGAA